MAAATAASMDQLFTSTSMASVVSSGNSTFDSIPWIGWIFALVMGLFVGYCILVYVTRHATS